MSERIRAIESRESTNVRNILESQSITDENVESKEKNEVQTLMKTFTKEINNLLKKLEYTNKHLKTLDDKIEELNVKEQHKIKHIFTPNTNKNGTVQCRYDQTGFCIQREQCSYLHTSEVCAEFVVNGYSSQLVCCKRHPKYCRNFMQ